MKRGVIPKVNIRIRIRNCARRIDHLIQVDAPSLIIKNEFKWMARLMMEFEKSENTNEKSKEISEKHY